MSTWERIDANGQPHALTSTQDKRAKQKFHQLMDATSRRREWNPDVRDDIDEDPDHLLIGARRRDNTSVGLIGRASDMHGPAGVCTCCPRTGSEDVA